MNVSAITFPWYLFNKNVLATRRSKTYLSIVLSIVDILIFSMKLVGKGINTIHWREDIAFYHHLNLENGLLSIKRYMLMQQISINFLFSLFT